MDRATESGNLGLEDEYGTLEPLDHEGWTCLVYLLAFWLPSAHFGQQAVAAEEPLELTALLEVRGFPPAALG